MNILQKRPIDSRFPRLFAPGYIGEMWVKNRLVRSPMLTSLATPDGCVTGRLADHYRELALGGVGIVTVEFSWVDNDASKAAMCQLGVSQAEHQPGLQWLACSNNLGPFQFPEKLIPLAITNALENKPIPIYGDGLNVRDWIYVLDHCRALDFTLQKGKPGEIYNIAANEERTNLELIHRLLDVMDNPQSLIKFVADRPGHDRRYALDITKITRELGWKPLYSFEKALAATVDWYLNHESWWRQIKSGDYAKYYDRMYSHR